MKKITSEEFDNLVSAGRSKPPMRSLYGLRVGEGILFDKQEIEKFYKSIENFRAAVGSAMFHPKGCLRGKRMSVKKTADREQVAVIRKV